MKTLILVALLTVARFALPSAENDALKIEQINYKSKTYVRITNKTWEPENIFLQIGSKTLSLEIPRDSSFTLSTQIKNTLVRARVIKSKLIDEISTDYIEIKTL